MFEARVSDQFSTTLAALVRTHPHHGEHRACEHRYTSLPAPCVTGGSTRTRLIVRSLIGGYLWSPKRNANGAKNPFYETMREVSPGDVLFVREY